MIIFHTSTQGCLNMKEVQGKFGGNFSGTMVKINSNNISLPQHFMKFPSLNVFTVGFDLDSW